jgi:hypothetical protein
MVGFRMFNFSRAFLLFLSLLLLAACDSDRSMFMTPKPDEPVVDVNVDEYSLNGTVLGKTATDISAIDSLLIEPIYKELRKTREQEQIEVLKTQQSADLAGKIKLHVDENLSYGDFYKSFVSIFWGGYSVFNIVIGSNYKDFFQLDIPIVDYDLCGFFIGEMKELRYKYLRNRQKLSIGEILDMHTKDEKIEKECYEKYSSLDLLLSYYPKGDGNAYVVSLNETFFNESRPFDGFNFYTFDNETDLWKFIENLRLKVEPKIEDRQDRILALLDGRRKIELVFEKDIPMKDIAPIIKKLNAYGYKITFTLD